MPDSAISALNVLAALANPDEFVIVDKSDTTMGIGGTNKRMPLSVFLADPVFLAALDARITAALDARYPVTAWATLPLSNGWVPYSAGYTPQYRRIGDNVQIRGLCKDGAATGTMFTLPAGFRPAYEETCVVYNNGTPRGLSIAVSGTSSMQAGFTTGYCYLSSLILSLVN